RIASDLDFLGTNDPPFRLGRIREALRSYLSRFARTLRQTFVCRCQKGVVPPKVTKSSGGGRGTRGRDSPFYGTGDSAGAPHQARSRPAAELTRYGENLEATCCSCWRCLLLAR